MCPVDEFYQPAPIIYELGEGFNDVVEPAIFTDLRLRFFNEPWARHVGLGSLSEDEKLAHFAKFQPLPHNLKAPLALRYHGHQFRSYNPDLGDGRGFLYAQVREASNPYDGGAGRVLDLGTKGSGQTPYSRRGDGRLTLKGAFREVLATEMLESLGVPTSKTFSVYETNERLERHDEPSPTRAGVLIRLNHSHIRFGSFQRLAFLNEPDNIKRLLNYSVENYFPDLSHHSEDERPQVFLGEVVRRSAELVARWLIAGFVHGVLNTDNMNITGESFDYGPYRFLPVFDPSFTAAYFDHSGLYAFGRQPEAVFWNLQQLAGSLSLIARPEPLEEALGVYQEAFNTQIAERFIERLGLISQGEERDTELVSRTFHFLSHSKTPFDQFFFDWHGGRLSERRAMNGVAQDHYKGPEFEAFHQALICFHGASETEQRLSHPYFQNPVPCSLLIDELERIWDLIASRDDWSGFESKISQIREMGQVYGRRKI